MEDCYYTKLGGPYPEARDFRRVDDPRTPAFPTSSNTRLGIKTKHSNGGRSPSAYARIQSLSLLEYRRGYPNTELRESRLRSLHTPNILCDVVVKLNPDSLL